VENQLGFKQLRRIREIEFIAMTGIELSVSDCPPDNAGLRTGVSQGARCTLTGAMFRLRRVWKQSRLAQRRAATNIGRKARLSNTCPTRHQLGARHSCQSAQSCYIEFWTGFSHSQTPVSKIH
jgi:hypothetical protein